MILRNRCPIAKTPGNATIVIAVRGTLIAAINPIATTKLKNWTAMIGANAINIWTDLISELARLIICPLCTRSKKQMTTFLDVEKAGFAVGTQL